MYLNDQKYMYSELILESYKSYKKTLCITFSCDISFYQNVAALKKF